MNHLISARQLDLVVVNENKMSTCRIVNFTVPADHRVNWKNLVSEISTKTFPGWPDDDIWYEVFLSNDLFSITWFQVFLSNTNNFQTHCTLTVTIPPNYEGVLHNLQIFRLIIGFSFVSGQGQFFCGDILLQSMQSVYSKLPHPGRAVDMCKRNT